MDVLSPFILVPQYSEIRDLISCPPALSESCLPFTELLTLNQTVIFVVRKLQCRKMILTLSVSNQCTKFCLAESAPFLLTFAVFYYYLARQLVLRMQPVIVVNYDFICIKICFKIFYKYSVNWS